MPLPTLSVWRMQCPIGITLSPQARPFSLDKYSLPLGKRTHRTRSISLAVFTTAKGSRRLQSQKCISLAVAISKSWAVGWKASDAMALLLSVNQLSLPPWVRSQESQAVYCAVWDQWVSMYVPSPKLPTAWKWHIFNSNSLSNTSPCHDHSTVYSNDHKSIFTTGQACLKQPIQAVFRNNQVNTQVLSLKRSFSKVE